VFLNQNKKQSNQDIEFIRKKYIK